MWDRLSFHGQTTPPNLPSLRKHSGYLLMTPFIRHTRTHLVSPEGGCPLKELAMREEGRSGDVTGRMEVAVRPWSSLKGRNVCLSRTLYPLVCVSVTTLLSGPWRAGS